MASLSVPEGASPTAGSAPQSPAPPSGRRRPTSRDVAALAGVSFKTVSRVVNHEPGVSPSVAERVRVAAILALRFRFWSEILYFLFDRFFIGFIGRVLFE